MTTNQATTVPSESATPIAPRFSPHEEATLLSDSQAQKVVANTLFSNSQYSQAIGEYDKALALCPNYLDYEIAVLKSNIAACHLKLEEWNAAVESATAALDAVERLVKPPQIEEEEKKEKSDADTEGNNGHKYGVQSKDNEDNDNGVVEISAENEAAEAEELKRLELADRRKDDIQRIRCKALMRRARAKSELGGWANLQGAEEDYKALKEMAALPAPDRKIVQRELLVLPARIKEARDREMGDMMGKLKELGNGILKPFGLSTDNFNMVKDEKTGGYSMNFNQNR